MSIKTNKSGEFIYITKNLVNQKVVGNKLIMKTHILDASSNSNIITNLHTNNNPNKLKNRIILSNKLQNINNNNDKISACLLTQENLHNNIKFDFRHISDNNISSRIVFLKYAYVAEISNNNTYLFKNLSNVTINNQVKNIDQNLETILANDISNQQNYVQTLNYYTQKHKPIINRLDFYNFKLQDFLYKHTNSEKFADDLIDSSTNQYEGDICFNDLNYELSFNDINLNIDLSDINYNINSFKNIYYEDINQLYNKLESSFNSINDNLHLFNMKDVTTTFTFNLKNNSNNNEIRYNSSDLSNNIDFFLINKFDFLDFRDISFGKIFMANKIITMNCRVLNFNNNFFDNNFNNENGKIFLSLGNYICGITQKNLSENVKINIEDKDDNNLTDRIFFTKKSNIDSSRATNNQNGNYINFFNDNSGNYLFDKDFKIDFTNIFLIRNTTRLASKAFKFRMTDILSNVPLEFFAYNKTFNNMEFVNNENLNYLDTFVDQDNRTFSSIYLNEFIKILADNLDRDMKTTGSAEEKFGNVLIIENEKKVLNYSEFIFYNFENNTQGNVLYTTHDIDLLFDNNAAKVDFSNNLINFFLDSNNKFFINFYKIKVQNFIDNDAIANRIGNPVFKEFTGCIFIYYDPYNVNTPEEFRYPNNNISIEFNTQIRDDGTAPKIILNDRKSLKSEINTVYLPIRNGSNYSKKQILGFIGLGPEYVPKLLSIVPYDQDSIIGRGFNNQFQINDECLTEQDKINRKINSQKNKNLPKITKKQNFANLVKNSNRFKNTNLKNECQINNIPSSISEVKTPFRFFKTNRGNYLRSR